MPSPTPLAYVIGEALIDAVTTLDGATTEHPGGSPANVALTLGRLGRNARLLSWIGADERGKRIQDWLDESNVSLDESGIHATRTSLAHATLSANGSATYNFDLEWDLPSISVPSNAIVAHSGSIAAVLEPGGDKAFALLKDAQRRCTITYDPNIRPTLMGDPNIVRPIVERYVALADVVKVSDEDLEWLYPGESPQEVAARWRATGPALVVVTFGGDGALGVTSVDAIRVEAPRTDVADTVGAGDSFMGALIHGLWQRNLLGGSEREALRAVNGATLKEVLLQCAKVAAVTVSRAGANPPWLAELG